MSKASSKASKSSKTSSGSKSNTKPKHLRGPNDANIITAKKKKKKKNDVNDEVKSDDDVNDDEMMSPSSSSSSSSSSFDLLSKKIARLETELAKESAYRNHAQLERDKTLAFWEISKRALRRSESIGREHERALRPVLQEHI